MASLHWKQENFCLIDLKASAKQEIDDLEDGKHMSLSPVR